jgi:hypothetical protein
MSNLKLIALDAEDLAVISTNLQDAVMRVADMAYLKREMRFAAITSRFDWVEAAKHGGPRAEYERHRAGLRFERVLDAKVQGLDVSKSAECLELLAIGFEPAPEPPEGHITLHFAGGGAIKLHVECIEAELKDLGEVWRTRCKPDHPASDDPNAS